MGQTERPSQGLFDKPLWTYQDAAAALGLTVRALQQRVYRGVIPYVKLGRSVRFHPDELAAWLQKQKRGAKNA